MKKLLECVPNFSEGKDKAVIDAISESIKSVENVKLLSVEMDADYNRSVVTFAGDPEKVVEAAFLATKTATEKIDMTKHSGGHPRSGATDVVPFIPIAGISEEECIELSNKYAEQVASELGVPVYLYEKSAKTPERQNLAQVRKGEYEALPKKLEDPVWTPDYGKPSFLPKTGVVITGVRKFLIAYNVNLKSNDLDIARDIAFTIRESGRLARDENGEKIILEDGSAKRIPGMLKCVKAIGVDMPEYGITQISMNLTDYHVTPIHVAYDLCKKLAKEKGIEVTGSEAVGLVPYEAIEIAGKFYGFENNDRDSIIKSAIDHLGLSDLKHFNTHEKIVELAIENF